MFKINFLSTVTTVSWIWFVTSSWSCSIISIYNIHTSPTNPIPVLSSPKNLQACHIQVILVLTSKDYSLQYHFISTLSGLLGFLWWSLHLCIIRVSVFFHIFHKCCFAQKSKQRYQMLQLFWRYIFTHAYAYWFSRCYHSVGIWLSEFLTGMLVSALFPQFIFF